MWLSLCGFRINLTCLGAINLRPEYSNPSSECFVPEAGAYHCQRHFVIAAVKKIQLQGKSFNLKASIRSCALSKLPRIHGSSHHTTIYYRETARRRRTYDLKRGKHQPNLSQHCRFGLQTRKMLVVISGDDRETVRRMVPKASNNIQAVAIARLYIAYPNRSQWTYTGLQGAVVLCNDLIGNTYWLKLVDISVSKSFL